MSSITRRHVLFKGSALFTFDFLLSAERDNGGGLI
ncbi:hypothetical protein NTGM5_160016 [Candidatus Nitrotoga sp. M5]|nr:hypothetical protein NTGM5_160016 [Candidatus Nitrotoga sp. M5]